MRSFKSSENTKKESLGRKTHGFELTNIPVQRARGVSTREDVLVHEETPNQVLVLPVPPESGDLEVEDAVILEPLAHNGQEDLEVLDANVLSHLKAGDFVVLVKGNLTVVVQQEVDLVGDLLLLGLPNREGVSLLADGNSGDPGSVFLSGKAGKGTPAAANVKDGLVFLEVDLVAGNRHLVVLSLLKGVVLALKDTARVKHGWAQKPGVEVVATIVDSTNLTLVDFNGVGQNHGHEFVDNEGQVVQGEAEPEELVAVLCQGLEAGS